MDTSDYLVHPFCPPTRKAVTSFFRTVAGEGEGEG